MGANPHANGGTRARRSICRDSTRYAIAVDAAGRERHESTRAARRDAARHLRANPRTFACSAPTRPTRIGSAPCSTSTTRCFEEPTIAERRSRVRRRPRDGGAERAQLRGLARGLRAHRAPRPVRDVRGVRAHRRVDGDAAREVARGVARRCRGARRCRRSTYLLTSTCWRNDHNGFSHQGPGFMDTIISKKGTVARVYLPPDANCLLSVADHCLRSRQLREPDHHRQAAAAAVARLWRRRARTARAARRSGTGPATTTASEPDVVLACAGDTPTLETLAAAAWLRAARAGARACAW